MLDFQIVLLIIAVAVCVATFTWILADTIPSRLLQEWAEDVAQWNQDHCKCDNAHKEEIQKTERKFYSSDCVFVICCMVIAYSLVYWRYGSHLHILIPSFIFTAFLPILILIDQRHFLLPDCVVQPLLWLGLIVNSFAIFVPLLQAVWGAVFGFLILWIMAGLFQLLSKKEAMGRGDYKFAAALGAWLGIHGVFWVIVVSSFLSIIYLGMRAIYQKRLPSGEFPYGPFLAVAGWIVLLVGVEKLLELPHF